MKKSILTLCVFACFLATTTNIFSQTKTASTNSGFNIGVVDVDAVVKEMPEAIAADKEMTEMRNRIQDTITNMRKELETKVQNYQKQKAMMTAANQQEEEEKLQREIAEHQNYANEKDRELGMAREKLLEPIRVKVKTAIETVAKDEKIQIVLNKDAATVLYSDSKLDITFRVIDRIKRNK